MATLKLTKTKIDAFRYEGDPDRGTRDVRWDTELRGFGVRVYPTGEKAYLISYRAKRRKRMMVIGDCGGMTLVEARTRAKRLSVQIDDGRDPLEEKRQAVGDMTLGSLIDKYVNAHAKPFKKTWEKDQRRLNRHIPASWKARLADNIAGWEISDLHNRIGSSTPYEANRLLEILRYMFKMAPVWGYLKASDINPTDSIKKFPEKKRKRFVKVHELPALAKAIDREPNIYVRAALWLYLLSGLRKSELLEARWEDVDWHDKMLTLPVTKAGEEQSAALSAAAIAILQAIPRQDKNPYILPGRKRGHHLVNIDKPWGRIRRDAGVDDLRLHDLRRSFGSWLSRAGVDLNVIKEALRHASISTTLTYARLGADPAREAIEAHGQQILAAAGKRGPVQVVGGTDTE